MRRVEVLLPPAKLDEVKDALAGIGVFGMTLSEVKLVDPTSRRLDVYRGATYVVDYTLKIKMELVVRDGLLRAIAGALKESLGSAEAAATKVLVFDIAEIDRPGSALGAFGLRATE
jgi:nitrogen regulatory protein P-II 1